jgi:hypothetical protein
MVRFQSYESALASNYILIVGIIGRSHLVASKAKVIRLNPRPTTRGHIDRGLCNFLHVQAIKSALRPVEMFL